MSDDREQRVKELLAQLLETSADGRAAVLELACGQDARLRSEVESLARAYEEAPEFLATRQSSTSDVRFPDTSEAAGTRIGRYTILEKIGEGGFGTVFLAEQMHPVRRTVALKILKAGMDTRQVIARFSAERQALAMMDHPNVAKVLDAGATDAGRPYFVMDLIRGTPITRYCDQHKLTIRQRLELFMQVCQGVQHAHSKGIIHRDLKPSNVLVTESDGTAIPKVIDFGIAKATTGQLTDQTLLTELRQLLGTPQYMSPEQADGSADIDTRSDVYSLGVILYELLSGSTPFDFKSSGFAEIHRIIREFDPPPPSTRTSQRELRGDLDRIVLKAMEKDRARRYETASAFASDIQRYLNDEPVTARPAGRIYRFWKLVRRNKLPFAVGAALMLTLAVGLITSTSLYVKARDAKVAQVALRDDAEAHAYASDMLGIQQALAVNNLGRARMLLDRHRPKAGEKDRRGWEWRYLWEQCRGEESDILSSQSAAVCSLAVSHDGHFLAVAGRDGVITVWDLPARQKYDTIVAGAGDTRVNFSPHEPLLAYTWMAIDEKSGRTAHVGLWDARTRKKLATAPLNEYAHGLLFSRDGNHVVTSTAREYGEIVVWKVPTLVRERTIPAPDVCDMSAMHFGVTPDLSTAAIATPEMIHAIDVGTNKDLWQESIGTSWGGSLALSPDGRVLAFSKGTAGTAIYLRDTTTGKALGSPLIGHLSWIGQIVFSPDGRTLASASADQTIRLWDVSDPAKAKPLGRPLRGHLQEVWRLAMLPDGKTLVSGGKDGSVYLWDLGHAKNDTQETKLDLTGWRFASDRGASILGIDPRGEVARFDAGGSLRRWPLMKINRVVTFAGFINDRLFFTNEFNRTLFTWDLNDRRLLSSRPAWVGVDYDAITPDGHSFIFIGKDRVVHEWDMATARDVSSWPPPSDVAAITMTPDGRQRLILGTDGVGMLTDVLTARSTPVNLDAQDVCAARFSHDGTMLAVSEFGYIGLWPTASLAASGKVAPVGSLGGFSAAPSSLRPWNGVSLHSMDFSPDGHRLAASGQGADAIKLFDLDTRQEVLTLNGSGSVFGHVDFSPDGTLIASKNAENELHIWHAPTLAEIDMAEAGQVPPSH